MDRAKFTIDELRAVLRAAAGEEESVVGETDILDVPFTDLGYDSLALLEAGSRIERERGIKLGDSTITEAQTPRALLEAVNQRLTPMTH